MRANVQLGWIAVVALLSGCSQDGGDDETGTSGAGQQAGPSSANSTTTSSTGGPADAKRIFVTKVTFAGNLAGGSPDVSQVHQKCRAVADAAALGGTWVAWISSGTIDAISQVNEVGPWYSVDRATLLFNDKANLQTAPMNPIVQDEFGDDLLPGSEYVWTGTKTGGTAHGDGNADCFEWVSQESFNTAKLGIVGRTSNEWTDGSQATCDQQHHLICVEQ